MSGHLIAIVAVVVIVWLALGALVFALLPGRAHRRPPLPVRGHWDENAQRWTTALPVAPEPKPVTALIDLAPGIDLGLRDDCELLWNMPAYQRPANHNTTTPQGDL